MVDKVAAKLVPFKEESLDGSESCEFDVPSVINLMIKGYGLEEASKTRSIAINQAIDGARLTSRLHHTTYGVKMVDLGACDPVTKKLIYGSCNKTTLQSKHYCHPIKIVLEKETNQLIEKFRSVMELLKNLTTKKGAKLLKGALPIISKFNADLSAHWKLLQKGYGVKRGDGYPCHICATKDCNIHEPNAVKCSRWCKELHSNNPNWQCYHQDFLDEKKVNEMRKELAGVEAEIQSILNNFDSIRSRCRINTTEDPRSPLSQWQLEDQDSIHFNTLAKDVNNKLKILYEENLHHDLTIRSLPTHGSLTDCQDRLQQQLIQEYNYQRLSNSIKHATGTDKSFILLADCTPCILHMEMQTTLKFLQVILNYGLTAIKDGPKPIGEKITDYLTNIDKIFNEQIFGTPEQPYTFKVPYDSSEKVIEDITLDGDRCRQLPAKFHLLLPLCVQDDYSRNEWIFIIEHYLKAFEILRSKEDLSKEEVNQFQLHVDIFFQHYMDLVGQEGITNYFHMLGSGHISDYLLICGNLYIHSQQGWEAFNSFLKVFYFRRTSRGGGKGSQGNRIRQLARWLARRLVWNSGMEYHDMVLQVKNMENFNIDDEIVNPTVHDDEEIDYSDMSELLSLHHPTASTSNTSMIDRDNGATVPEDLLQNEILNEVSSSDKITEYSI